MPTDQIDATFDAYAERFGAFDTDGICDFWIVPAVISVGGTNSIFESDDAFKCNITSLCKFYKKQGVERAVARVSSVEMLTPSCALTSVEYAVYDNQCNPINDWKHLYILKNLDRRWRITFALADEEVAAWERRGTPLV